MTTSFAQLTKEVDPMTTYKADLILKLQELHPNMDFGRMIKEEFEIDLPENALDWEKEFIYKYLLQAKAAGEVPCVEVARQRAEKLMDNYPYIRYRYDNKVEATIDEDVEIVEIDEEPEPEEPKVKRGKGRPRKQLQDDTQIVYNVATKRYEGYVDGVLVTRLTKIEKVHALMKEKHGIDNPPYNGEI